MKLLSIDVGMKCLAYCLFSVDETRNTSELFSTLRINFSNSGRFLIAIVSYATKKIYIRVKLTGSMFFKGVSCQFQHSCP